MLNPFWNVDGCEACVADKCLVLNVSYRSEIAEFLKLLDVGSLESGLDVFHRRRFLKTELPVIIGVPVVDTEGFHSAVGKVDESQFLSQRINSLFQFIESAFHIVVHRFLLRCINASLVSLFNELFQFIGEFIVKVSQVYACLGDESPLNSVAAFRFDIPIESVGRVGDVGLVVELRSEEFSFGVGGVGGRYLHGEDIAVFHGGLPVSSGSNVSIDEAGLHSFSDFGVVGCPEERVVSSRRI